VAPTRVLAELECVAARLGIAVRAEPFGTGLLQGRGGFCRVRGEPLIVMDAALPAVDRIALLAKALAQFELEGVRIAPAVRDLIEAARTRSRHAAPGRRRPGLARTRPKG
jgi:hypothetical protein